MWDWEKICVLIIAIIVLIVLIVFFVGMGMAFNTEPYIGNTSLKTYYVWFTVLFIIYIIVQCAWPQGIWLYAILFIISLIFIYIIYGIVKNTTLKYYTLPLLIVMSIIFFIGLICFFYTLANQEEVYDMVKTYSKKYNLNKPFMTDL